ncbi:hypothetical protein MHYP_G00198470 [Metynnis hypsauchen]
MRVLLLFQLMGFIWPMRFFPVFTAVSCVFCPSPVAFGRESFSGEERGLLMADCEVWWSFLVSHLQKCCPGLFLGGRPNEVWTKAGLRLGQFSTGAGSVVQAGDTVGYNLPQQIHHRQQAL